MIVLGLHKDPWHNSGATIIRDDGDGPQFAYISEERMDRVKDSRSFPECSTRACMEELGIEGIEEIDLIVLDYILNGDDWRQDYHQAKSRTDVFLADVPASKVRTVNHHLCHAFSTFYSSSFEDAAVLVIDGRGSDHETQSLFHGTKDGLELVETTDAIGIGLLYAAVTNVIGFGLLQEGKTMGLAPYGDGVGSQIFDFKGEFDGIRTDYSAVCAEGKNEFKVPFKAISNDEEQARAAFEVQEECERAMLHLAEYAKARTGSDYLCISGGVGLNSVSNYKCLQANIFKDVFINPAASDTGIPLGAALYGYHQLCGQPKTYDTISPFLGPSYSEDRIETAIKAADGFEWIRNGIDHASEMLAKNQIVGCFQGRSEMGPRALGNRSILMSPIDPKNKDTLNSRVKHREAFRPFAPAILEERVAEYFEIDRPSPYMLFVPTVVPDKRDIIPAVTHVDGTARVQTVTKERNPHFRRLVESFEAQTGVPVLLNTSFNDNGEPIVETPEDAIRCFLKTDIDALLIGDHLLIKAA
ncbi:MAG: carbamoyltransferase [Alphaproteobacteria bacterium]|nr:carbamoyltransferase [Alphaproteobacteria bacterium]